MGVAEDVLANPSRGQIGQHLFVVAQMVKVGTRLGAVDQAVVGVHHALGVASGARGEKHGGHIVGVIRVDFLLRPTWVRGHMGGPGTQTGVQR